MAGSSLTVQVTQVLPHLHDELRPQAQVVLHLRAAQVQVAVPQAERFRLLRKATEKRA